MPICSPAETLNASMETAEPPPSASKFFHFRSYVTGNPGTLCISIGRWKRLLVLIGDIVPFKARVHAAQADLDRGFLHCSKITMIHRFIALVLNISGSHIGNLTQRIKKGPQRTDIGSKTLLLLALCVTAGLCFEQEWRRPRFHFFGDGRIPGSYHAIIDPHASTPLHTPYVLHKCLLLQAM